MRQQKSPAKRDSQERATPRVRFQPAAKLAMRFVKKRELKREFAGNDVDQR